MTRLLLLAQLPPPVHGVTVTTARVFDALKARPECQVEQLWAGSAGNLGDVNQRTAGKYVEFAGMNAELAKRGLFSTRADVGYVTLAPWTHAAMRDCLVAWWSKRVARRTVVHLHGEGLELLLGREDRAASAMRHMLAGTELIAITGRAAATAEQSGLFSRVWRLPNAAPDPGEPRFALLDAGRPLRLGFLGNLDPRKGVLRVLDIVAALKASGHAIEARIAGGSTPQLSVSALAAEVEARRLGDSVRIEGPVAGAAKAQFLAGLDVFLYPSTHDHAPLVVIEAMSYGVPPIVIDTGGVGELLGPALSHNVLPARSDDAGLVAGAQQRIADYIGNPGHLADDKRSARRHYADHFTEERFVASLAEIVTARPVPTTGIARVRSRLPSRLKVPVFTAVRQVHAALAPRTLPDRVAIYFHALDNGEKHALTESVEVLRSQGYSFVSMDAYLDPSRTGKLANISFDDNYRNWFEGMALFDHLDIRGTFYVNTLPFRDTCTAGEIERYFDRVDYRGSRLPLSRSELKDLAAAGHEIACHSHSHHVLSELSEGLWEDEIGRSKLILEGIIDAPVRHFSWPYGMPRHITPALRQYCRDLGFVSLAAGTPGLLHAGPWDAGGIPRSVWRADRPVADNLADLAIDGTWFTRLTGRSAVG